MLRSRTLLIAILIILSHRRTENKRISIFNIRRKSTMSQPFWKMVFDSDDSDKSTVFAVRNVSKRRNWEVGGHSNYFIYAKMFWRLIKSKIFEEEVKYSDDKRFENNMVEKKIAHFAESYLFKKKIMELFADLLTCTGFQGVFPNRISWNMLFLNELFYKYFSIDSH